ncbi:MBL fold metallo-hydrolase [Noviherbaspirillum denitrificans]|uniref:MBL fold metallo-hydrolase n=1 Tax=Noviherbaspirillum denitrificans TaxID=1968433 RepID=A0A254T7N6_9BURK|nr:MBL fold metallo-hydrolase [Noviherbaspirillum denitrificans]OWW18659.1 MBL fold metallo-hydrolase [Noviherbaspirillum denitrificans]
MNPQVDSFYDGITGTISHVVHDGPGSHAAIIDPVLDYDPKSARTHTASADKLVRFVREHSLKTEWILETHAHADHLSAAKYLKDEIGGKIAIGAYIGKVQGVFKQLFNLEAGFAQDGSQFDHLFEEDESFRIGALHARAIFVPGHTPADVAYRIGDTVFVGDTLFMPDVGTARCDFPGGDARSLYRSIQRLLSLPGDTRLFMCHDYPPPGRAPAWVTTVAEQRAGNAHVREGISEDQFVAIREKRDAGLDMPTLFLPSIQVNIRAGSMPPAEGNGISYLKLPLNAV